MGQDEVLLLAVVELNCDVYLLSSGSGRHRRNGLHGTGTEQLMGDPRSDSYGDISGFQYLGTPCIGSRELRHGRLAGLLASVVFVRRDDLDLHLSVEVYADGIEPQPANVGVGAHLRPGFCVSTDPASVRVAEFERPSCNALEAVVAVLLDDCLGVPDCASALPARDFAVALAVGLRRVSDARRVTLGPDCSRLGMAVPRRGRR